MLNAIRIVVVDDHPLWRAGVTSMLKDDPAFEVVAEGRTAKEGVRLAANFHPDLMLLDVSLEGGGIRAAQTISVDSPAVKVVMLTVSEDEETVLAALSAGAKGYVLKGVSGRQLLDIVKNVHAGETYITPALASAILIDSRETRHQKPCERSSAIKSLSKRELQILKQLAKGQSNRQIAEELFLSEKTIKHYMTNILQKLHVRNRVEAALLAQEADFEGVLH